VGGRYRMEEGEIEVDAILPIELDDITPAMARRSGFRDVPALLDMARHGPGENVYLVEFHYRRPRRAGGRGGASRGG
jgi:hypothetical protein